MADTSFKFNFRYMSICIIPGHCFHIKLTNASVLWWPLMPNLLSSGTCSEGFWYLSTGKGSQIPSQINKELNILKYFE